MKSADNHFLPGDRVVLQTTGECGVVVLSWFSAEIGAEDCYIAFFGEAFPAGDGPPAEKPYVLRYAASSLRPAPST